jgi:hypothetical protein
MNSKIFAITFLLTLSSYLGFSQQSMSDYSYIEVPEIFDFMKEKNQYQLSSMTKFYFNKYGFNAYLPTELPNVTNCDGLYADLETELGFTYTKIVVVVKDCNGLELFRSAEGRSKLKEYKKTYQEALRNAFKSFERLGIKQKEIEIRSSKTNEGLIKDTSVGAGTTSENNLPSVKFSSYTHSETSYLLKKTALGYSLFQEMLGADDDLLLVGKLTIQSANIQFTDIQNGVSQAYFDKKMNLTIKLPSGNKVYLITTN